MRWPRARRADPPPKRADIAPVVVAVTAPLNRATAQELAHRLDRLEPDAPVVIDVTAIPAFDTDGADALLRLQERVDAGRVSIVGFRQATERLVGGADELPLREPVVSERPAWVQRRLRNLVVVQPAGEPPIDATGLEPVLVDACKSDSAIVVVDLRGIAVVGSAAIDTIAFASSMAALHGQELLVVNVSAPTAEALRSAGLSATTYVAPEPPVG